MGASANLKPPTPPPVLTTFMLTTVPSEHPGQCDIELDGGSSPANDRQKQLWRLYMEKMQFNITLPGTYCNYQCVQCGPGLMVHTEKFDIVNNIRIFRPFEFTDKPTFVLADNVADAQRSVESHNHSCTRMFN